MDTDDDQVDPPTVGARVIRAGATLDATAVAELRREAWALLARSVHPLVVDLTAVRSAEPVAAALLRDLAYEAGDADVDLRIVRDPRAPGVTGTVLDDETLFEIYPSLDAALQRPTDAGRPAGAPSSGPGASGPSATRSDGGRPDSCV